MTQEGELVAGVPAWSPLFLLQLLAPKLRVPQGQRKPLLRATHCLLARPSVCLCLWAWCRGVWQKRCRWPLGAAFLHGAPCPLKKEAPPGGGEAVVVPEEGGEALPGGLDMLQASLCLFSSGCRSIPTALWDSLCAAGGRAGGWAASGGLERRSAGETEGPDQQLLKLVAPLVLPQVATAVRPCSRRF